MLNAKVTSGILGFVVGDALGVPVEFESREDLKQNPVLGMRSFGSYCQPAGTWSDDSSMTLCTLESLTHGLDCEDMMQRFLRWADEAYMTAHNEVFDMGKTTREALMRYVAGIPALECGAIAEQENGNGSLMRILPLALHLWYLRRTSTVAWEELFPLIHDVSRLTHAHPISLIACGIYCTIAYALLNGEDRSSALTSGINRAKNYYADLPEFRGWLDKFSRLDIDILTALPEHEIQSSGYVLHTLEAALWCLLHTDTYRDCMFKAVNLGSDTDTVAAVAGGLAGILYGESAIPEEWLATIAKQDQIRTLCQTFRRAQDIQLYTKLVFEESYPNEDLPPIL